MRSHVGRWLAIRMNPRGLRSGSGSPAIRLTARGLPGATLLVTLAGCDPVFDIEGAFFPSWMVALVAGVLLTVGLRLAFVRIGLEPYLGPAPLIYTCLAMLLTMTVWVVLFRV